MSAVAVQTAMSQPRLEGVNDSIISLFECPVCYEYLVPPIHQCENAHNICSKCKPQMTNCPTCKETFLSARSVFAEQIAERLFYPCKNFDVGCSEKNVLKDIVKHHAECPLRMYECLPGKTNNCEWKGRSFEILNHMTDSHAEMCWMVKENNVFYDFNVFEGTEDLQLVSACDEIFWYNLKCDTVKQQLLLAVQYIGRKNRASNFTYEFLLHAEDDEGTGLVMKTNTHPDVKKASEIYESGHCVVLDFARLRRYVSSANNLSFCLKINKKKKGKTRRG